MYTAKALVFDKNMSKYIKWKLMLSSIPVALLAFSLKLFLTELVGFEGILELSEISLIISAGVFLIGFMLAGTMADYKESEKVPGEIAASLENIEEKVVGVCLKQALSVQNARQEVQALAICIFEWLIKKRKQEEVYSRLTAFNTLIHQLDMAGGAPPIVARIWGELHHLRKMVTRTSVISRTGFLQTGYALLEMLLVVTFVLLVLVKFKSLVAMIMIVFFITLIYVYMYRLIKDIDDPFEYHPETADKGAAEVALFPITEYMERLEQRLHS